VAALVVLTSHVLVSSVPPLANGILVTTTTNVPALDWALLYTPLHVLWGGAEAVTVFFVLSGYVLALPVARGRGFRPASYYPHRLLRLFVPVWGALCLAALVHVAVEGSGGAGTWWLDEHTRQLVGRNVSDSLLLFQGAGTYSLLGVLWSLHWEVVFSLLLPLFLLAGRGTRRFAPAAAAVALAVLFLSGTHKLALYLPPFMLGTLIAFQHERIDSLRGRLERRGGPRTRLTEAGLWAAAAAGLTANWWLRVGDFAPAGHSPAAASRLAPVLIALGACAALAAALAGPRTRRLLETRPMQWAGTRSYSLYLVHEPVVVGTAFALGGAPGLPRLALVAVPAALLVTEAFHRAVERPSHALARRAGTFAGRLRPA
jgi:peptidoglycan/LPS O-acetylase OafA/YrhL